MKPDYTIEGAENSTKLTITIEKGNSLGFFPRRGIEGLIRNFLRDRLEHDTVLAEEQPFGEISTVKEIAKKGYKITLTIDEIKK